MRGRAGEVASGDSLTWRLFRFAVRIGGDGFSDRNLGGQDRELDFRVRCCRCCGWTGMPARLISFDSSFTFGPVRWSRNAPGTASAVPGLLFDA